MIKKLVFFLYIGEDLPIYEYLRKYQALALHFSLLKRYSNVFDESVFVLSLKKDLMGNTSLIKRFMTAIINLGFYNVRFKIEENTEFRECKAFKEEVVENKDNDGKLVFFGHNKGTTNDFNESLYRLICSMYYFNLNFVDEAMDMMISSECAYFGFPLLNAKWNEPNPWEVMPTYKYFLYGTFFWTNWTVMNEIVTHKGREYPQLSSRFYAENFPANTVEMDLVGTHKNTYALSGPNLHYEFDKFFDEYCEYAPDGETTKREFNEFVEKIKGLLPSCK